MIDEEIDLFSSAVRNDPYPSYQRLREHGPVCRLKGSDDLVIGRHADIKAVLGDWRTFSSSDGVALNDLTNTLMVGTAITSDPPDHSKLRGILARPLQPAKIAALRSQLSSLADERIAELVGIGPFDAMERIARLLPLTIISKLVGLPEKGREQMLQWAAAAFNCFGPEDHDLTTSAFPVMGGMIQYISDPELPDRLTPGSWAADLWDCTKTGELTPELFQSVIQGYVSPSLDTTIYAIGNLLWLLSQNPDQWAALKAEPSLITRCVNEALRLESPALGFTRVARRPVDIGDVAVPEGARIVTVLPSGNRDERRYADPARFDIRRDSSDHLAFGGGVHRCVGGTLAMLEITTVLQALVRHVSTITYVSSRRAESVNLRGFAQLELALT